MKNKYYEYLIQSSKDRVGKKNWLKVSLGKGKFACHHVYSGGEDSQSKLPYWYDFMYRYGSRQYTVVFTHPRLRYTDLNETKAYDLIADKKPKADFNFKNSTPVYKKLGKRKNRKRIIAYKLKDFTFTAQERQWYDLWEKETQRLNKEGDTVVEPCVKVEFGVIDVCVPFEIHSDEDAAELFKFLNEWMSERSTGNFLNLENQITYNWFKNYQYNKESYNLENK